MNDQNKQYLHIRNQLAAALAAERFKAQSKLPSERELSERYGCTRVTVREALMQMEAEGLIYRRNRRGWFVTPPRLVFSPTRKLNFMQMVDEQNRQGETRVAAAEVVIADTDTCRELMLAPGEKVYEIIRIRSLEGRPVLYEFIYFSQSRFPDLLDRPLAQSLTVLLREHYGERVAREQIRITSATIDPRATEALEVLPGRSGVCIRRCRSNPKGEPVERDVEYWLSDAIEVQVDTH